MLAICVHSTPGRLRLRSSAVKNNPRRAQAVQRVLGEYEGVHRVEANTLTGSVLVAFDPAWVSAGVILRNVAALEEAALPTPMSGDAKRASVGRPLARAVGRVAVEKLIERLVVVALLAVAV